MSYCRFSSDNWKSDVYVYEDTAGGYTVHVASHRLVDDAPPLPPFPSSKDKAKEWLEALKKQEKFVAIAEKVPIGGPYDGQTLHYNTIEQLYNGLIDLMDCGYYVPQSALEQTEKEMIGYEKKQRSKDKR